MATLDQKMRKALRGYLERLGNMSLADRVKYADAFDDVYNIVLNSPEGWNCAARMWPPFVSFCGIISTDAVP